MADIIVDTDPAGIRLTDAAVADIAALFDRLDPQGRNWSTTDDCLAVIRRVPVYQAEDVAAELVNIARGCAGNADGYWPLAVTVTNAIPIMDRGVRRAAQLFVSPKLGVPVGGPVFSRCPNLSPLLSVGLPVFVGSRNGINNWNTDATDA